MKALKLCLLFLLPFVFGLPIHAATKLVEHSNVSVFEAPCGPSINLSKKPQPFSVKNEIIVKFLRTDASIKVGVTCVGNSKHAFYFTLTPGGLPIDKTYKFIFACTATGASTSAIEIREFNCSLPGGGSSKGKLAGFATPSGCAPPCKLSKVITYGGSGPIFKELDKFFSDVAISPELYAPANLTQNVKELATPEIVAPIQNLTTADVSVARNTLISSFTNSLKLKQITVNGTESKTDYFLELSKAYAPGNINAQQFFTPTLREDLLKIEKSFKN